MSFLGSLVGAVSSYANQQQALQNSKELTAYTAQTNYKYAKKSAQNSPSWNRAGLEKAGYNPMLAVQNATSGANSSWTSNASAPMADITSGMSNATQALQAKQRLDNETQSVENQTNQTESQIDANSAAAEESRAKAANYRAENPYISQREEANIRQTDAQTTKLNSDTDLNKATIKNMESRLELDKVLGFGGLAIGRQANNIQSYNATTARKAQELEREKFEGSQDKFMADFAKNHPRLYAAYRHMDNAAGLAGRIMGATPSFSSSNNYNDYETHSVKYDRHGNVVGQQTTKHHSNSGSKKRSKK